MSAPALKDLMGDAAVGCEDALRAAKTSIDPGAAKDWALAAKNFAGAICELARAELHVVQRDATVAGVRR